GGSGVVVFSPHPPTPSPRRKAAEKGRRGRERSPLRGLAPGRGAGGEDSKPQHPQPHLRRGLALVDRFVADEHCPARAGRERVTAALGPLLLDGGPVGGVIVLRFGYGVSPRTVLALLDRHQGGLLILLREAETNEDQRAVLPRADAANALEAP